MVAVILHHVLECQFVIYINKANIPSKSIVILHFIITKFSDNNFSARLIAILGLILPVEISINYFVHFFGLECAKQALIHTFG